MNRIGEAVIEIRRLYRAGIPFGVARLKIERRFRLSDAEIREVRRQLGHLGGVASAAARRQKFFRTP